MTFALLVFVCIILYVAQTFFFIRGIQRLSKGRALGTPNVSVIIAVKDEERNIRDCLESLVRVDYPRDRMEVLVVDDDSADGTAEIVKEFVDAYPFIRFLRAKPTPHGELRGKQRALAQAVPVSTGDFILLTDADCRVQPGWVWATVQQFEEGVGVVGGFAVHTHRNGPTSLLARIQAIDMLYLLGIAAGGIGWGRPLSLLGANLALRRKVYDELGGYEGIPFSLVEDLVVVKLVARGKRWSIGFSPDPEHVVVTQPAPTLMEFLKQRKRWTVGALMATAQARLWGFDGLIIGLGFLTHVLLGVGIFLGLSWDVVLPALATKIASDLWLLTVTAGTIRRGDLLSSFLAFEAFYFLYLFVVPAMMLTGMRVTWKGRKYY